MFVVGIRSWGGALAVSFSLLRVARLRFGRHGVAGLGERCVQRSYGYGCGLDTLAVVCNRDWDREQWRAKGQGRGEVQGTFTPLSARKWRDSTCFRPSINR